MTPGFLIVINLKLKKLYNFTDSDDLLNRWRITGKNLEAKLMFVDFFRGFDSIHIGKTVQIILTYGIPTLTLIIILCFTKTQKQ